MELIDLQKLAGGISHHVNLQADNWILTKWNESEVDFAKNPTIIVDNHEKMLREILDCEGNPGKTVLPTKVITANNILTTTGLTESAKRDTGETATTVDYCGIGTDSTSESESQSSLLAENSGSPYARRRFSTQGQRKVVNQTGKYGVLWQDSHINAAPLTIREAGLFTAATSGVMHARVVFSDFTLSSGDLFVVQVNELHQNGSL
jgi:hypothetical protein